MSSFGVTTNVPLYRTSSFYDIMIYYLLPYLNKNNKYYNYKRLQGKK